MQFHYIATDINGRIVEGDLNMESAPSVLGWMREQSLRPVSIKEIEKKKFFTKALGETITIEDKIFMTKYLALMLRVGTDLFSAIDILIEDFDKASVRSILLEMKQSLSQGQPIDTVFAKHPKHFSPVFVSLIRAGQRSGNLEAIFERLSNDLEKEKEIQGKVKAAFIYPMILVGLSLSVLFLMVTFALPRIAETFMGGGVEPPAFSRAVFSMGLFFREYSLVLLPTFVLSIIGFWFFFSRTVAGKRVGSRISHRIPVVNGILLKMALERFATTFSSLLRSGTPILDSLEITADAVGFDKMKLALTRISRERVSKGVTIGEAFRQEPIFPKTVANLIAISEKTGHMEDVLETLAAFYNSEIDSNIKILVSFLEPVLLLLIGLAVGGIALAIIIPVYQLVGQI
ncbi:MAG: hypothetical protein COT88_01955 [Candidatus Colwellbacteria bacterium CG10_big_fil_rev_8_21_14_0_10_41_28]|uniref:Type II secretion system protein GspF domain-containing protein n=1 Tax=Candidatus Colwellbacteria bacterium CG10_big_fil_rev_8_21_14_0_10_41_28 TaxID=1974539 RepID=A0A2H0VGZ8_9BACT|nr:MAG: hypothetical protein COT88_01955 [Candidatus Colwellbacteria bacterium CG10_big_fil_rev_8_21_14_0_10_41_28]